MQLLRTRRRSLVLLVTFAMLALSAPAKAALPSSSPTHKHRCANGKTAKTWIKFAPDGPHGPEVARLAADNPCRGQWVQFSFSGESESDPYGLSLFVAPGQRLNWEGAALAEWGLADWLEEESGPTRLADSKDACVRNYQGDSGPTGFDGILFFSDTDVRSAPECGQPTPKYSANRYAEMPCPSGDGTSYLTWKTEGKKLVKLAMSNGCGEESFTIARWKLDNGRTVGLWIEPGRYTDLWKSDFGTLPVKTKDGRVLLTTYPVADEEDAFRSDPKNRPFYYNGYVHDDSVVCTAGQKSC